jgi:hypothetical protein
MLNYNQRVLDTGTTFATDANGLASGNAFVQGQLEKLDAGLNKPLTSVTWPRDIVAVPGGGWVDFTSFMNVDYATAGANQYAIIGPNTNVLNTVQTNLTKDVYPVFDWGLMHRMTFINMFKAQNLSVSIENLLHEGVEINYNKTLDQNAYLGFSNFQTTGLVNNPAVSSALAPVGAAGSRSWVGANAKTYQEIMADINGLINSIWTNAQYDMDVLRDLHILVPPNKYSGLTNTLVGAAGSMNILTYFMQNNLANQLGGNLTIVPSRWTIGQGAPLTTGGAATDRLVAYVNNQRFIQMDLPVPLTRQLTQTKDIAYETPYLAQIGAVKFKYTQIAQYLDGI